MRYAIRTSRAPLLDIGASTPPQRHSTGSSRPRSSAAWARGAPWNTWSSRSSDGSTGTTSAAFTPGVTTPPRWSSSRPTTLPRTLPRQPSRKNARLSTEPGAVHNRALFTRITIDDEENATYTPEQTTASVLAHTSIDAPAHVTAETKLPRHQAGQVSIFSSYVELRGFEPLTFSLRTRRATNCAIAPCSVERCPL